MKKFLVRSLVLVLMLAMTALPVFAGAEAEPVEPEEVTFALWTQEGESEGVYQWIEQLAADYMTLNPKVTIEVVRKDTEALREDFQTASLAGAPPELLWTVSDQAGPFTAAGLIRPVDDLYQADKFVESVIMEGNTYAVPISAGNHLMLLYNKDLLSKVPENTDEFIKVAQAATKGDVFGLVYNMTEPFWMVPWLGGFGGKVFADDGITPTLDTKAMVDTLQFLADLKYKYAVTPVESDYATMDTLFKEGKAAMLINGDWSLSDYAGVLGDKFGVARLPMVSSTGKYPAPYTAGKYFMVADGVEGIALNAVKGFIEYVTSAEIQNNMLEEFKRLPALLSALNAPVITADPILKGSAAQLAVGTPMPTVIEMRANWDAMKPEMNAVLAGTKSAAEAAEDMQSAAEAGIRALE
ncbi:MAG: extracellular solute-binding protein [Bacteroidetes bacterium]|nr:extracellular solute-binding protein [Bacteroidota bacterium]